MLNFRKIVMAGVLALATAAPVAVEAAPMISAAPMKIDIKPSGVTDVRCWHCGNYGYRGRYYGGPRGYYGGPRGYYGGPRGYYGGNHIYYGGPRYWGPRYYWGGPAYYWGGPHIVVEPTIVIHPRPRYYRAWCGPRWDRYRCLVRRY